MAGRKAAPEVAASAGAHSGVTSQPEKALSISKPRKRYGLLAIAETQPCYVLEEAETAATVCDLQRLSARQKDKLLLRCPRGADLIEAQGEACSAA